MAKEQEIDKKKNLQRRKEYNSKKRKFKKRLRKKLGQMHVLHQRY